MKSDALMARMFDRIAPRYDFLNRLLSFRRDVYWRRQVVAHLPRTEPLTVIDVATGTGDLAIAMCEGCARVKSVVGVDIAAHMLAHAQTKVADLGLSSQIALKVASASALPFEDASFDVATVAFGVRNFAELGASFREMARVLKSKGQLLVLEFSMPQNRVMRFGYLLYFRHVLPRIGALVSRDPGAYAYLNSSVEAFHQNVDIAQQMRESGLVVIAQRPMTFGVATLYVGEKR